MPTHLANERELVDRARAGDHEAFTRLVEQYERHIYRLALSITGDPADAEDVLQEAFLKAYSNLGSFQGDSRFYTWLVRITVNEALMKLRKRRARPSVSLDDPVPGEEAGSMPQEIEDWGENPERRYAQAELQSILAAVIERLEPAYRMVFVLRDIEELSTEETARILKISIPAVKSRLLRARLMLRERLSKYFKRVFKA